MSKGSIGLSDELNAYVIAVGARETRARVGPMAAAPSGQVNELT